PASYIVLAGTHDGVHMAVRKTLVQPVTDQRNQNPNLFRDARTGRFYLTWYRGSGHSEIVSRNADRVEDLDRAPDKILLSSDETLAAPTLLFLSGTMGAGQQSSPIYYLSTEIHPRGTEWQTKVFVADAADADFRPVAENSVLRSGHACLFQHIFH